MEINWYPNVIKLKCQKQRVCFDTWWSKRTDLRKFEATQTGVGCTIETGQLICTATQPRLDLDMRFEQVVITKYRANPAVDRRNRY